jgi:hypothetical protein
MSKLILKALAALVDDLCELYWLTGVINDGDRWTIRAVFRGLETGTFHTEVLPIGTLPLLALGSIARLGALTNERSEPGLHAAMVNDVGAPEIVTSAEIPADLYSFGGRRTGVQKVFVYRTRGTTLFVPVVELVRYLFAHNRTLANALWRPNGLEQLYVPQLPGVRERLDLRFSAEMPLRCLSNRFATEFAWLALDPDGRRSWDSVRARSDLQPFILFDPPRIRSSIWHYRGVKVDGAVLVREIVHLSGRRLPFKELNYGHPKLKQVQRVPNEGEPPNGTSGNRGGGKPAGTPSGKRFELDPSSGESGSLSKLQLMGDRSKLLDFENRANVVPVRETVVRPEGAQSGTGSAGNVGVLPPPPSQEKVVVVSAGERASGVPLPPLEFQLLNPLPESAMGNLDALDETVRHLRDIAPSVQFERSLVALKSGRAFSEGARQARAAMIVMVTPPGRGPIVLLDVERTWVPALSLLALRFELGREASVVASCVKQTLDGIVDGGGHWCSVVEEALGDVCLVERIPKLLCPRVEFKTRAKVWALRLAERLQLGV